MSWNTLFVLPWPGHPLAVSRQINVSQLDLGLDEDLIVKENEVYCYIIPRDTVMRLE